MTDEKELKDQRVPIMMTASELEAIDDWMFKNRIRSRGEAIRRLCQVGLSTNRHLDAVKTAIAEALESNLLAVHRLEEDFVTKIQADRGTERMYAKIVVEALEKLAKLHGRSDDFIGEVAPFLNIDIDTDDALAASASWRHEIEQRFSRLKE